MSSKNDSKTEIKVPKHRPTVINRGLHTSASAAHPRRNLWSAQKLDTTTNEFDIISSRNKEPDAQLKDRNPQLLALRNKTAKSKTRPRTIRPITAMDQAQTSYSLLSHPTTTTFKSTSIPTSVQRVQQSIENERASISFKEDPIAYFAKRKEGGGHQFIYLNYTGNRKDPAFNPYDLEKVPFAEVKEEYFTMSASGVTRILPDGNTEQFSIDIWAKESSIFASIRKLRFFSQYYYWHPFRFWKKFVMKQRYNQITQYIYKHPYWSNSNFFSTMLTILESTSDTMIKKYLLPFIPQKKYTLEELHSTIESNKKSLFEEYSQFLNEVTRIICDLFTTINDPERVKVEDTDFQEIKRKNPNIEQLIVLEQKVHAEKERRIQLVKSEISSLSNFIRMIDYMLLESMAKSCSESWTIAASNISQDKSGIFLIEVSFSDEGKISFNVPLETLIENVRTCLNESFVTLNNLPRLNQMAKIVDHIIPKEKVRDWPTFESIRSTDTSYSRIEDTILDLLAASYKSAEESSQMYIEYFTIFRLGKDWTPEESVKFRGGDSTEYNLSKLIGDTDLPTPIVYNRSKEKTVDTTSIRHDIERFKKDSQKMSQFHTCTMRGCLLIDSRQMKNLLTPIPARALETLHSTLCTIFKKKIELLNSIFSYCSKKLKKEPASLEQYVDFCEFTEAVGVITPYLAVEITLTDELRTLLEELEADLYEKTPEIESSKNLLHDAFKIFKNNKQTAKNLKEINEDKFVVALQQRINVHEEQLNKLNQEVMTYPEDIKSAKVDSLLPETKQLKQKVLHLEPEISALQHCQNVMGIELNELSVFQDIKKTVIYNENLYSSIRKYNDVKALMDDVPFAQVDIAKFGEEVDSLNNMVLDLRNSNISPNNPSISILNDLNQKVDFIVPMVDQLKQLANGNMKLRHWNRLFDECGVSNLYTKKITINGLSKLGILSQKEKIQTISSSAQNESQLETDFSNIKMKWIEVQLPLLDSQVKADDSLLLGDVDKLFQEISDAQIRLQQILSVPHVQTIRQEIQDLSEMLENYAHVLDAWITFQSNWTILSCFFAQEETKSILEAKSKRFQTVRRRWMSLVRHTLENTTLYSVCTFPSLLDMLVDNNKILESILSSLNKFIDQKREAMPRLYFLSNDEVLTLFSTTDFAIFDRHLIKLFMHFKSFDYRIQEKPDVSSEPKAPNVQDFSRLKIYGFIGDTLESIVFDQRVFCGGQVEKWIQNLINFLHDFVKSKLEFSLQSYSSISLNDWVLGMPTYIALLTLHVIFTKDIDECFANLDNNSRAFTNYENSLIKKIADLSHTILSPLANSEILKLSAVIALLNSQMSIIRTLSEKVQHNSPKLNWKNRIKLRFNQQKKIITVEFGDIEIEHRYEYWASGVQFIYTPSGERALMNLISAMSRGESPYFFGSSSCGKKYMISDIASIFGTYIYDIPSFHDKTNLILERLLIGAARTGFWLTFHSLHFYSQQNLCFLYETVHEIMNKKNAKEKSCYISGNKYEMSSSYPVIFFTGDRTIYQSKTIPHQFRSYLKPIAMSPPDIRLIAEIRLISYGFKASKHISLKLFLVVNSIISTFRYLNLNFVLKPLLSILDNANQLLRILLLTKNQNVVVDYYESSRTAEEFVCARSVYDYFIPRIDTVHIESFFQILYGHFQIFNNYFDFKLNILNRTTFPSDQKDAVLIETIKKVINNKYSSKLSDYLIEKTISLYHMMENHKCIIIYGDINSGKSSLVDILNDTIKALMNQHEDRNKFTNLCQYKIFESFYLNDIWTRMYGEMTTNEEGPAWLTGQLHSFFNNISKADKTHHNILRFNGPLTDKFIRFLNEIMFSSNSQLMRLNSMDSYYVDDNFRVIIETDSINNLNPSMMMNCALLPMNNLQFDKTFSINDPEIVFNRALRNFKGEIDDKTAETFKKLFIQIAPTVVHYVFETENFLSKTEGGNQLISDHMSYLSMELALHYYEQSSMQKKYDESQIKTILILAFYSAFSGIIWPSALNIFDNWIRVTFFIEIPEDWVGFNTPDPFWDFYQRPSIQTLQFYKGKLIPIDFSLLLEKPIQKVRIECPTLKLPSDFSICAAQYLPVICESRLLARKKRHFIIHGPKSSGKSSLLQFVFLHSNDIVPITIPVTNSSNGYTLQKFISSLAPIITKKYMTLHDTKTYALIFDNVPSENLHALEFIRMLVSTSSIPSSSRNDSKYLDFLQVQHFFVIVLTDDISRMPSRFLSQFFIMHLNEPAPQTINYVISQISSQFDISPKLVECFSQFSEQYCNNKECPFIFTRVIELIALLNERAASNERELMFCVRSFLFELNYLLYHKITNVQMKEQLKELYLSNFNDTSLKDLFSEILDGNELMYPEINMSNDLSSCSAGIFSRPLSTIRSMLYEKFDEYNKTKGINKFLEWTFHRPVVNEIMLLLRAISYPGTSVVLKGDHGSGRYRLACFVSYLKDCSFYPIPIISPLDDGTSHEKRREQVKKIIQKAMIESIMQTKHTVIFFRIDSKNKVDTNFLSNLFLFHDFYEYFTTSEIDDIYYKVGTLLKIKMEEKHTIYQQIVNSLKLRTHFIVAADYSFESSRYSSFVEIRLPRTDEFNLLCAKDLLKNPSITQIAQQIPENMPILFTKIHSIIRSYFPHIMNCQFEDFLTSFIFYASKCHKSMTEKVSSIKVAIGFKEKIEEEIKIVDEKKKNLDSSLHALNNDDGSYKKKIADQKSEISLRKQQLEDEERLKTAQIKQTREQLLPLKTTMIDLKVRFDLARQRLESISPQQLELVRQSGLNPSPAFKELIEMFCVFMNITPQYEPYGKRLLYDPQFYEQIKERIDPQLVDPSTLEKATLIFTESQFTKSDFDSISMPCSILHDYIDIVYRYASSSSKLNEDTKVYDQLMLEFDDFTHNMATEKGQLSQRNKSLDHELKNLQNSAVTREHLLKEIEVVDSKKRILENIYKGLDVLGDKWKQESDNFDQSIDLVLGNSIIFAAFVTYFGTIKTAKRNELVIDLCDEIKRHGLVANVESPLEFIEGQLALLNAGGFGESESVPEIQNDIRLIKSVPRTPLIIDPDCVILNAFINSGKIVPEFNTIPTSVPLSRSTNPTATSFASISLSNSTMSSITMPSSNSSEMIVVASIKSSNLFKVLKSSAKNGYILLLEDVDFLDFQLIPFLSAFSLSKKVDEISVKNKVIKLDPNFRLFLFTTKIKPIDIPANLRAFTTLVDVSERSLKSVQHDITCCFLSHFDPEMLPRLNSMQRAELMNNLDIMKYERQTLDSIEEITNLIHNDKKYDYLSDDDKIKRLLQAKECYFAATNVVTDFTSILNELKMTVEPFTKSIRLCLSFWVTLSRFMPRVRNCHFYSLPQFISLITSTVISLGFHEGILQSEHFNKINASLTNHILKWVLPTMSINESLLFFFISGFECQLFEGLVVEDDLPSIFQHIESEFDGFCDFTVIDWHNGQAIDHLKFTNIVNIFSFVDRYITEIYGSEYKKFFSYFSIESFLSTSSSVPVLIQLNPDDNMKDATQLLEYYITLRSKASSYVSISLCEDPQVLSNSMKLIEESMRKDVTIAIHYSIDSTYISTFLNDVVNMIATRNPNRDFRAVLICSTTNGLPRNILKKCVRVEYEAFPSIRQQMFEIYNHHASAMQSSNSQIVKKQIYSYSLLFSLIRFRMFMNPIGFSFDVPIDEVRLRNFFVRLKELIETTDTNFIPIKNIRDDLLEVEIGGGVFDQYDYKKLKWHVFSCCSADIINDGFCFIDPNSDEIDKWTIPNDVSSLNYSHALERIPLFATTEILMMNRTIGNLYQNWCMSKWVSKPFIKLSHENELISISEAKSKLNELITSKFPKTIKVSKDSMKTPTQIFLYGEIQLYNKLIVEMEEVINETLCHSKNNEFIELYRRNKFPKKWANDIKMSSSNHFTSFLKYLNKKCKMLSKWLKNSMVPTPVDVRYVSDLKSLMFSYLNEIAIQRQMTTDVLSFEFVFNSDETLKMNKNISIESFDGVNAAAGGLLLSGLSLVAGNWDFNEGKLVLPNSKTQPISSMPELLCVPVKTKGKSQHVFICPLYRSIPSAHFMLENDMNVVDGVAENLQWEIPLKSDVAEKLLVSSGVSLICQKPDIF